MRMILILDVKLTTILTKIQALLSEKLVKSLSEDEQKFLYIFIQVFRVLISIFFVFSFVSSLYIGLLLNPQSSLFEWSRDHKYLVMTLYLVFGFIPAAIIFGSSSILDTLLTSLYKNISLRVISPRLIWAIGICMLFLGILFLGLIWSFSGV
jgi:hypothetical protein